MNVTVILRRRTLLTCMTVGPALTSLSVDAKEVFRIGVLGSGREDTEFSINQMIWLRTGLRTVGLVEGKDFVFDAVWAGGDYKRFPAMAAEVIARGPGAVIVSTIAAAEAARSVSRTIPIVMTGLNDPVRAGLVANLARPGGNITGMATLNESVVLKLLQFVISLLPGAKKITTLRNPSNPSSGLMLDAIEIQAAQLGFAVANVDLTTPATVDKAFEEVRRQGPDVLLIVPDNALAGLSKPIVSRALEQRLPVVGISRENAEAGGILSYGFSRQESVERVGVYIKKIMAGANPADLPVEQPAKFELIVNRKTARALGIEIPIAVLATADEIVE